MPGYPAVMKAIRDPVVRLQFDDLLGEPATVLEVNHEGLDILVLDAPAYYDRPAAPISTPPARTIPTTGAASPPCRWPQPRLPPA
jgi:starch synthase